MKKISILKKYYKIYIRLYIFKGGGGGGGGLTLNFGRTQFET